MELTLGPGIAIVRRDMLYLKMLILFYNIVTVQQSLTDDGTFEVISVTDTVLHVSNDLMICY